jgi:hypothetical protein
MYKQDETPNARLSRSQSLGVRVERVDEKSAFGGHFKNQWLWLGIGLVSLALHVAVVYSCLCNNRFRR